MEKTPAFADRLVSVLNDGALCLMISVLALAGFRSVEKHELAHDVKNNWYVIRK